MAEYLAYEAKRQAKKDARLFSIPKSGESERRLHEQILSDCSSRGWIAIHSRMDRPATTAIGSPDFVILANQGRVLIIEAKSAKGKLTKEQAALRCWAGQLGHTIHLIRSYEEFVMLATVP